MLGSNSPHCNIDTSSIVPRRLPFLYPLAVLVTSSLVALAPLPYASLYGASRAFVSSLALGLREELSPYVAVTCVYPGATDTEFAAQVLMRARHTTTRVASLAPWAIQLTSLCSLARA